jgi:dienelactone hydrolase
MALAKAWAAAPPAFPGVAYREYARCLPDFLRDLAQRAYQERNREIARLTSVEAIRQRQKWARETFWKLAGGMPQRTPLNTRTLGAFDRSGYRVEKLVYESVPNFHIAANLYIPSNARPPFPGVLFQMGHTRNGKAGDTYQRCCQGLAKLGYLVLAFDPMGQGERIYYPDASARNSRLGSADDEHTVPGKQMLLVGDSAARMQVWDAVRSLDVLAAHPLVDPQRLASTGQSGGATLTMLLAAVDDRLAAAAVCSGNTENVACADFNPPGSIPSPPSRCSSPSAITISSALTLPNTFATDGRNFKSFVRCIRASTRRTAWRGRIPLCRMVSRTIPACTSTTGSRAGSSTRPRP